LKKVFNLIGDSPNPLGGAIRKNKIDSLGVRNEEGAALAAAGQTSPPAAVAQARGVIHQAI
jgi:pyruvate dehydrogenase (quinone)